MRAKIFLWIFVLCVMSSFAFGLTANITYNHGYAMAGSDAASYENGVLINSTRDLNITHVCKDVNSGVTLSQVFAAAKGSATKTQLANCSYVSNCCKLNGSVRVNNNSGVYVVSSSGGASVNHFKTAAVIPFNTTPDLRWEKRAYYFGGIWNELTGDVVYTIANVTIQYYNGSDPATNFTITAKSFYFNETLYNFTALIGATTYYSNVSSGIITTGLLSNDTNLYNITLNSNGFDTLINYNTNVSSNLVAYLNQSTYRLNFTAYYYNITSVGDLKNTPKINNYNITIGGITYAATSGVVWANLTKNTNYTIILDTDGYELKNTTINLNAFLVSANITAHITNGILFTFLNQTEGYVYNVSIELIGALNSYNYTTNPNATKYIDLIMPSDYQIIYTNPSYPQGYYSFTLTNRSFSNLTLYFISGTYSNITAYVYDELGNLKPNSIIEVYRYSTLLHSYVFEQQAVTNWQGKAILYLQKFNTFYKFNIKYQNVLRLATDPTYILDDTISFNFIALSDIGEVYFTLNDVTSSLTFNNNTNNFRYEFDDLSASSVSRGCLYITKSYNSIVTDYNSSCLSGYSGTILMGVAEQNGTTYTAKAYVTIDGTDYFMASLSKYFTALLSAGNAGLFYAILLTIVFAFIGLYSPVLAIILTPLPFLISAVAGLININPAIMVFMELIAVLIAFVVGRLR